ncbi:MAG: hypothetical protein M3Z24_00520 [Chloroflexota bacterium]|nr:hypothetical protein [Chloroflexota bacterium]
MQNHESDVSAATYEDDQDDVEITDLPDEERHTVSDTLVQLGSHLSAVPVGRRRRIFTAAIFILALLIILPSVPSLVPASNSVAHFFVPPSTSTPASLSSKASSMSIRKVGSIEVITSFGSSVVVNTDSGLWQTGNTLGPPPTNCPDLISDNYLYYHGKWHGRINPFGPVSIPGFQLLGNTIHILRSATPTSFGWAMLIRLRVKTHFSGPIALSGWNMTNGIPLTYDIVPYNVPDNPFIFDPQHPLSDPVQSDSSFRTWDLHMYLPESGCYLLEARWTGGVWQAKFAAGK